MTNKEFYVEDRCTRMLFEVGVPANLQGFRYLRTAISKVIDDPELLNAVTKKLYPTIAEIYGVGPTVIERSIRHAIEVAFNRKGTEGINKLFDCEICDYRYKPSNSELIALLAEKLISEIKALYFNDSDKDSNNDDKNKK